MVIVEVITQRIKYLIPIHPQQKSRCSLCAAFKKGRKRPGSQKTWEAAAGFLTHS